MKPLLVLLSVFGLSCLFRYYYTGWNTANLRQSGCVAMAAMMAFTSVAHWVFWRGMILMIPSIIPYKKAMVYFTGVIELLAAAGLLLPATRLVTGILLILFFIIILPANIIAARQHINLEKANYMGSGLNYLWFRVPLQLFFIAWVYWCAL